MAIVFDNRVRHNRICLIYFVIPIPTHNTLTLFRNMNAAALSVKTLSVLT